MVHKPAARTVVRISGIALVVVLAGGLAVRAYGKRRLAVAEGQLAAALAPFSAADFASPAAPKNENAAIMLRAGAMALLTSREEAEFVGELALKPAARWTPNERAEIGRILAVNELALELLDRSARLPHSSFDLTVADLRSGAESRNLPLISIVRAARLLVARGALALDGGDEEGFLRSASAVAAIGRSLGAESPLIAKLIGIAGERMFLGMVRHAVATPTTTPNGLATLGDLVGTIDLYAEWRRSLAAEHALWHGEVTRGTRDDFDTNQGAPAPVRWLVGLVFGPMSVSRSVERLASLADAIGTPYALGHQQTPPSPAPSGLQWLGVAGTPQVPNLWASAGRFQATLSQRRLARIAIALRLRAAVTGFLPDSLASLPDAGGADPFTGGALRYERRGDGSALLELPGADKLYTEMARVSNACPFHWEIAPPSHTDHVPRSTDH